MLTIAIDRTDPKQCELARLIVARNSIQSAMHAASYVVEKVTTQDDPLFGPMEAATVICYARPFTRGGGKIPPEFGSIGREGWQRLHDVLLEYRHAFIAHSDETLNEVVIVPPGKHVKAENFHGVTKDFGDGVKSNCLALAIFREIVGLCEFQIDRLSVEIELKKNELEAVFNSPSAVSKEF